MYDRKFIDIFCVAFYIKIYRITGVMYVEKDIISSFVASLIGRVEMLLIILRYFKTEVIVFVGTTDR